MHPALVNQTLALPSLLSSSIFTTLADRAVRSHGGKNRTWNYDQDMDLRHLFGQGGFSEMTNLGIKQLFFHTFIEY